VTHQDLQDAGVSYRRLHYWTTAGLLHPVNPNPGTGHRMQWPIGELRVAQVMRLLVDALEMSPGKAAEVARCGCLVAEDGDLRVEVRWGLVE
jgi:hypothetical protein